MIPRFSPTAGWSEIFSFLGDVMTAPQKTSSATTEFEHAFAEYVGRKHAVFAPSGRMSLWLVLQALDYLPGSEIIVPSFTYFAIPAVIQLLGLKPVYAEIDPLTFELSAASVEAVMTEQTRAVIPTHLFGRTCEMTALKTLCDARDVTIIEDCAQCMGASIGDKKAGTFGTAAYFTFGITKNFTTFGGGMLACEDDALYSRIQELMNTFHSPEKARQIKEGVTALAMRLATRRPLFSASLGLLLRGASSRSPDFVQTAFEEHVSALSVQRIESGKWRPTDAQARAGLRQLKSLDTKNETRRERGNALISNLKKMDCRGIPLAANADGDHIFVSFALTRADRYAFGGRLRRRGVDTATGYMSDCSSIPELGGESEGCLQAARVANEIIHLPLYPDLTERDIKRIANAVLFADHP